MVNQADSEYLYLVTAEMLYLSKAFSVCYSLNHGYDWNYKFYIVNGIKVVQKILEVQDGNP